MTQKGKVKIDSVEYFLAHIHAMKCESESCLEDLADCLSQHNNRTAADMFTRIVKVIKLSLKNIEVISKDLTLPDIPPWKYQWNYQQQPDNLCLEQAHYLMPPLQALDLAIFNESRIEAFYRQHTEQGVDENIRQIANELSSQEQRLIEQMQSWREELDKMETNYEEDYDPPNMPE